MEGVMTEREILRALKDYTELRAVLVINGKEVDLHLSNLKEPTWMISECDQETKELALPVVRRLYEALFMEGRYRS